MSFEVERDYGVRGWSQGRVFVGASGVHTPSACGATPGDEIRGVHIPASCVDSSDNGLEGVDSERKGWVTSLDDLNRVIVQRWAPIWKVSRQNPRTF